MTALTLKFWGLGHFSGRSRHVRNADTYNIREGGDEMAWKVDSRRKGILYLSFLKNDGFSVFTQENIVLFFPLSFPVYTSGPVFSSIFLATIIPCQTLEAYYFKDHFHGDHFVMMLP